MLEIVTPPAAECLTAVELREWLRIDSPAEDALLDSIAIVARQKAEAFTGRFFITQTQRRWLDGWPRDRSRESWFDGVQEAPISNLDAGFKREIDLLTAPLVSVSSIKFYGTDNSESTMSSDDYYADVTSAPARVALAWGKNWPSAVLRPVKSVAVQYVVGYGDAGSSVPTSIVHAMKEIALRLYDNRGGDCDIPAVAKNLLDPHVLKRL